MTTTEAATAQAAVPVDDDAYLQIQRFYARQSQLLDFGHFGAWAATFTEDGSFDAPNLDEPIRGRDALEAGTRRNHSQVTSGLAVRHWFGMTVAQTRADGAVDALSYVLVIHTAEHSGPGEPAIYRSTTAPRCRAARTRPGRTSPPGRPPGRRSRR
jgi:hypothetical protein